MRIFAIAALAGLPQTNFTLIEVLDSNLSNFPKLSFDEEQTTTAKLIVVETTKKAQTLKQEVVLSLKIP